jgi:hypothetical protein
MRTDSVLMNEQSGLAEPLAECQNRRSLMLWKWLLRLTAVGLALMLSWVDRFFMNVDGISYLDMAYAYMRADWKMAVNAYWGAGYSWLLGVFLAPLHIPPYWESTVVHLVNFLVFIATLVAFEYFLTGVIQLRAKLSVREPSRIPITEWTWWVLGYLLFMVVNVHITPVTIVTPDLCVEALVLLASGIIVRIASGRDNAGTYVVLGMVLGLAYLIKSPMFPMGLAYLGIAWLGSRHVRCVRWRVAGALATFLFISGPYIIAISRAVGRPTIGENARITYAHYVFGIDDFSYWRGQFPGAGNPRHPDATRKLMQGPDVYQFAATGGTLPPYYNTPYWADGLVLHLDLHGQFRVLRDSAKELFNLFYYLREFVLVLLILVFLQESAGAFLRRLLACWPIWLPGLVAIAMYAPVHIELRFLGGYVLLLWAGVSFSLEFPDAMFTRHLLRAATLALAVLVGYRLLHEPTGPLRQAVAPVQRTVAQSLLQRGIRPGDRVAQMLFHTRDVHYWAHLAGVSIVAEIPFEEERKFWTSGPQVQGRVEHLLQQTGAKVLVTQDPPPLPPGSGWDIIPGTNYAVLPLTAR